MYIGSRVDKGGQIKSQKLNPMISPNALVTVAGVGSPLFSASSFCIKFINVPLPLCCRAESMCCLIILALFEIVEE